MHTSQAISSPHIPRKLHFRRYEARILPVKLQRLTFASEKTPEQEKQSVSQPSCFHFLLPLRNCNGGYSMEFSDSGNKRPGLLQSLSLTQECRTQWQKDALSVACNRIGGTQQERKWSRVAHSLGSNDRTSTARASSTKKQRACVKAKQTGRLRKEIRLKFECRRALSVHEIEAACKNKEEKAVWIKLAETF